MNISVSRWPSIRPTRTFFDAYYFGSLSKSTDGGETWLPIEAGLPSPTPSDIHWPFIINELAIDPLNTSTLFVATTNGIFKTIDAGQLWSPADADLPDAQYYGLAINPVNPATVYVSSWGLGVYKTMDGGMNWSYSGLIAYSLGSLAIDPEDPANIYVGTNLAGIFRSTNGGQTWSSSGFPTVPVSRLVIDPLNPSIIYATTWGGGVFKSTDRAVSWQPTGTGP